MKDEDHDVQEKVGEFILEALEPWTHIEGSEVGDAQQAMHEACHAALNYMDYGIDFVEVLDHSIREMLISEWFTEMLSEESPPYDYYTQSIKEIREKFTEILHKHVAQCKQFGGKYGGKRAEELIKAWKPPSIILPGEES